MSFGDLNLHGYTDIFALGTAKSSIIQTDKSSPPTVCQIDTGLSLKHQLTSATWIKQKP